MKHITFTEPKLAEIVFWDHAMNAGAELQPIECRVIGEVIGHCKNAWYVVSWSSGPQIDHNTESFTILKNVVIRMTPLQREVANGRKKGKRKAK